MFIQIIQDKNETFIRNAKISVFGEDWSKKKGVFEVCIDDLHFHLKYDDAEKVKFGIINNDNCIKFIVDKKLYAKVERY